MINSISRELSDIKIPLYNGEVSMIPFQLSDLATLPSELISTVKEMIKHLPEKAGEAFLTVHGKFVRQSETLRRGAPHIDGNYIKISGWDTGGGGNGWKVGEGGASLTSKHHDLSYRNVNGGMLITSNYSSCMGWNGNYEGEPREGGDCSHIDLGDGFMLKPNRVYYGSSQFIHESLPVNEDVFRVMFRITLPVNYPPIN